MNTSTADQTRLVIVGASGTVGGYALRYALDDPAVGSVTAIGRRSPGMVFENRDIRALAASLGIQQDSGMGKSA